MISILDVDSAQRVDPRVERRKQRLRIIGIGILVPTLLALVYYALIARPEYTTETQLTIQGLQQQPPDLLGGLGVPSISRAGNDGLVIVEFIRSRALVSELIEDYGFDAAYGGWSFDPAGTVATDAPLESKTEFWLDRSTASFDPQGNIITVRVSAFTPEESLRLAEGVVAETEQVVNALNSRVQNEAVRVADEEVAARRDDYDEARALITDVRANRATTLEGEAAQDISLLGQLEGQLANARVERAASIATFRPNSPQIQALDERIAALEQQRAQVMAGIRGGPGASEATQEVNAQTALLDYEFAQRAYYAALQARQQAAGNRENERRYLVAFVPPRLPEVSNYWSRFINVIAVALAAALLMAVAALGYAVVKDHMQ